MYLRLRLQNSLDIQYLKARNYQEFHEIFQVMLIVQF